MKLRDYQIDGITDIRKSIKDGYKAPLYCLPTGGGKTAVAADIIQNAREKSRSVLFLAPRRELIYQVSQRLDDSGIYHGIIMAGEQPAFLPDVQVACIPTLYARALQRENIMLPKADIVMVDESHIGVGGRAQQIIDHYKDSGAVVVGLTATPARTDGLGLGMIYDDLVCGPSVSELTEMGYLVPARYFVGSHPDLTGVKVSGGDYNKRQVAEASDKPKLVGDIVENWLRLASDRQTFVYATSVAHSVHLAERFRDVGVKAEHIDGNTELEERKQIQQRLRDGDTQVLVNCEVLTYGVDFPNVSCIVLAKPTKSIVRYLQIVGRGLRPTEGKTDCYVLDHIGAVEDETLGFVDDPRPWTLNGKTKVQDKQKTERPPAKEITCPECQNVFRAQKNCPNCGHEMGERFSKALATQEAELVEIDKKRRKKKNRDWSKDDKRKFYGELKAYARSKAYKHGWAAHKYKTKFGVWPNDNYIRNAPELAVTAETRAWITSQNIRRAKALEKSKPAAFS